MIFSIVLVINVKSRLLYKCCTSVVETFSHDTRFAVLICPESNMANPRKFSEKIALHNQKQAEETAEFERIMQECTVTRVMVSNFFVICV